MVKVQVGQEQNAVCILKKQEQAEVKASIIFSYSFIHPFLYFSIPNVNQYHKELWVKKFTYFNKIYSSLKASGPLKITFHLLKCVTVNMCGLFTILYKAMELCIDKH